MTLHAWFTHQGVDAPVYALIHPEIFKMHFLNVHIMKFGGVAATARMAMKVLDGERRCCCIPAPATMPTNLSRIGTRSCSSAATPSCASLFERACRWCRSCRSAHMRLCLSRMTGGSARSLGLDKLGVERLPLTYSMPLGWTLGSPFNIPFPAQISIEMGVPIDICRDQAARRSRSGHRQALL